MTNRAMSNKKFFNDEKPKINQQGSVQKRKMKKNTKQINKSAIGSDKKMTDGEVTQDTRGFELERTSTPNHVNLCEHCNHDHLKVSCI